MHYLCDHHTPKVTRPWILGDIVYNFLQDNSHSRKFIPNISWWKIDKNIFQTKPIFDIGICNNLYWQKIIQKSIFGIYPLLLQLVLHYDTTSSLFHICNIYIYYQLTLIWLAVTEQCENDPCFKKIVLKR